MSSLQSLDIAKRSATTTPSPDARHRIPEVAKLIDVSSCIGCKACQVACMEWNDLRDEVGTCHGTYDNPVDLTPQSWTVMKFSEVEVTPGRLEWLKGLKEKPSKVGVVHGDDTVTETFAQTLHDELGMDAYAPYSGTVFDIASGEFEYTAAPKRLAETKARTGNTVFDRLIAAGQRLMGVIRKNEHLANKDMAKFADQVNSLSDKWD